MKNGVPAISIPVDVTNPGQFFACCGLFELADRLWPGSEAWFEGEPPRSRFQITTALSQRGMGAEGPSLHELLSNCCALKFESGDDDVSPGGTDEGDDDSSLKPIAIQSPVRFILDWWSDKSIKPWAGSMKERSILESMLNAIDPANPDPMNDSKLVFDSIGQVRTGKRARKLKKKEPFYFDCRRGSKARSLDSGFSPDAHHMESHCFPAVEAMCFVGLQRARPSSTDSPNQSTYTVWATRLPINVIGPVVCGIARLPSSSAFAFDNFFRTDQRKHKSYSRATRIRSIDV